MVGKYTPLLGCHTSISYPTTASNSAQSCPPLFTYKKIGTRKISTSSYHPSGNGGVKSVNHIMAQMLPMVVNERTDDWDVHLPHVEFAHNNPGSAATGMAANEAHKTRVPRVSLTVLERLWTLEPGSRPSRVMHATWLPTASVASTPSRAATQCCPLG